MCLARENNRHSTLEMLAQSSLLLQRLSLGSIPRRLAVQVEHRIAVSHTCTCGVLSVAVSCTSGRLRKVLPSQ